MAKIKVYILFRVDRDRVDEITATVRGLRNVTLADTTSGPYNVIAVAEADNINDIADLVVSEISGICDVSALKTCISVKN